MTVDERGEEIQDQVRKLLFDLAILWTPDEVLDFVETIAEQMRREIAGLET